MRRRAGIFPIVGALLLSTSAIAQSDVPPGSVIGAAETLKPGEYLWAPEIAPRGPLLLIVSLATQRATLYRNGIPIAITTVSTGKPGHRTPVGVFTILQREAKHFSSIYDNAPMPYMQRLTWGGVALHGGNLPGYPASHGCIRLPHEFARLLYGATRLGMTVIVTNVADVPRIAPSDPLAWDNRDVAVGAADWHPERAPAGSISVVISSTDQRVVVLRNGIIIGSAPVRIEGPVTGTTVFVRRSGAAGQGDWLRVELPERVATAHPESFEGRISVDPAFRAALEPLLEPGTSVIITTDSLRPAGTPALPFRLEDDRVKHSGR